MIRWVPDRVQAWAGCLMRWFLVGRAPGVFVGSGSTEIDPIKPDPTTMCGTKAPSPVLLSHSPAAATQPNKPDPADIFSSTNAPNPMLLSYSPAAPTHQQVPISIRRAAPPCPRAGAAPTAEALLPGGLRADSLPRHVAVVMDGNSRWARARGLPSAFGHEAGRRALEKTVRLSRAWGIPALTAFAFSHENWSRPKVEVDFLMGLFERVIHDSVADFLRDGIRVRVIGDCSRLPVSLQRTAREAEEATRNNSQLDLALAISYSGRRDIVQACRNLAQKVHDEMLGPEDIDESLFANELKTSSAGEFPYPDLLIRTSGELRLSNFLLWQSAYSELFFTDTLWPDFGEADYLEALSSFQSRDRRFGARNM